MNSAALTLKLNGDLAEFINLRANAERLPVEDARQEAWLAIAKAVHSHDPGRGKLGNWAKLTVQNHLHRLAHGHDGDPLMHAASVDCLADKLAKEQEEQDDREVPRLGGIYGRILGLARQGLDELEIAHALGYSRRRIQQLLADTAAIRAAAGFAVVQGDLFEGEMA